MEQVKSKTILGYHDVRARNVPDNRLTAFVTNHLPLILPEHKARFDQYKDLLAAFVGDMSYHEFAARVRRRKNGQNEDHDWEDDEQPDEDLAED